MAPLGGTGTCFWRFGAVLGVFSQMLKPCTIPENRNLPGNLAETTHYGDGTKVAHLRPGSNEPLLIPKLPVGIELWPNGPCRAACRLLLAAPAACCLLLLLLDAQAPPKHPNNWINRQKYYGDSVTLILKPWP